MWLPNGFKRNSICCSHRAALKNFIVLINITTFSNFQNFQNLVLFFTHVFLYKLNVSVDFPGCTDLDAHAASVLVLPDAEAPSPAARPRRSRHRASSPDHQRTTHRQRHVRHQTQSQL